MTTPSPRPFATYDPNAATARARQRRTTAVGVALGAGLGAAIGYVLYHSFGMADMRFTLLPVGAGVGGAIGFLTRLRRARA